MTDIAGSITREEFEAVRPMLEAARRKTRPRKHDLYDVFCAVLCYIDTGIAWRNMPPEFPPWRTVKEYFTQWQVGRSRHILEQALRTLGRQSSLDRLPGLAPQK